MKRFLLLILIVFPLFTLAQDLPPLPILPKDSTTNQVTYKQIVELPGVTANDIYSRSREWFATTFKSANSVLQMDDKAAGKLIGKGVFIYSFALKSGSISVPMTYTVGFTINITIKEGKYRIVMSDYTITTATSYNSGNLSTFKNIYDSEDALRKGNSKTQKQVYDMLLQLIKNVDTDSQATMASLKSAASVKAKDDF